VPAGRADYGRLTAALSARAEPVVTMTWQDLDDIVGGLPPSATEHYPQWWHGDRPNTRAWRRAGYELVKTELGKSVTFRRVGSAAASTSAQPSAPPPVPARLGSRSPGEALRVIAPGRALLVVTCSGGKARGGRPPSAADGVPWPQDLRRARARLLATARAESLVLPAWRRYTGTFYQNARPALGDAVAAGHVVVISGGYGIARAEELIGWYDRQLHLADWPAGLLESVLIGGSPLRYTDGGGVRVGHHRLRQASAAHPVARG
jgi:hypothetical protein